MTLGNMRSLGVQRLVAYCLTRRADTRLRWSRLHGLSQDEEERGGVVNRGARDERSSK
jgi:hypothetical protein